MKNNEIRNSSNPQSEYDIEYEHNRNRTTGKKASEVIKISREKAKKALYGTIVTTLAISFAAGFVVGAATNEAKHNKNPLPKEQYEATVDNFLELKEDSNIRFEDNGSVTVSYSDYWKGNHTKYELQDSDGDARFESGTARIENNRAGATFKSEHGLSIEEANGQLNSGLAQKLSSTGNN